ncbi:MAG: hypothetical protein HC846_10005 [Blastocatellia bacterium]|nr:hypothetical protein [Blastocatellia bacterium]
MLAFVVFATAGLVALAFASAGLAAVSPLIKRTAVFLSTLRASSLSVSATVANFSP